MEQNESKGGIRTPITKVLGTVPLESSENKRILTFENKIRESIISISLINSELMMYYLMQYYQLELSSDVIFHLSDISFDGVFFVELFS